jgi:hypothetical protein
MGVDVGMLWSSLALGWIGKFLTVNLTVFQFRLVYFAKNINTLSGSFTIEWE